MKKVFMCSLCHNGIIGGALYVDEQAVTYRTQKLTVHPKLRNLSLPLKEIKEITWKQIHFPIATFHMCSGEEYTFLIFNKNRFVKWFDEVQKPQV